MSKKRSIFAIVSAWFQSIEATITTGNRLDKAYAEGVGKPDYHNPFTLESNPQLIAMNQAGLYAADSAANILAAGRTGLNGTKVTEEAYETALNDIANNNLSKEEVYVVKNAANLAWRAGQPFRDIVSNPLNRITRDVNVQFNELPADEEDKDLIQVCEGARIILEAFEASSVKEEVAEKSEA